MRYRYRLWGINWIPLILLAGISLGLWTYLKFYDSPGAVETPFLKWKIIAQGAGWFFLAFCMFRGWMAVRFPFYAVGSIVLLSEIGTSVYRHDGLRFLLSLILGVVLYGAYSWIEGILERADVNPRLHWYQGKLNSVPHVNAHLGEAPVQVRTIDETGAFILLQEPLGRLKFREQLPLTLKYKKWDVTVKGKPIAALDWETHGLGLHFSFEDLYHQNEYTSLVQQLKGEGLA